MSSFLKKVLWILLVVFICQFSIKNVFASCDLSKLQTEGAKKVGIGHKPYSGTLKKIGLMDTGQSTCFSEFDPAKNNKVNFNDQEGQGIATCMTDGSWEYTSLCSDEGFLSNLICVQESTIKAVCKSADIRCTSPKDRQPGGTFCNSDGNIWKCDGYIGQYFLSTTCETGTKCTDTSGDNSPAKCVKVQCIKDGKTRNLGESICTGDYLNKCEQGSNKKDFKFTDNTSENLCKFGCVEKTQFAECLSSLDDKKNICKDATIGTRTNGETACFGTVLKQCSKTKPGEFAILEDCQTKGQRCDTIDKNGNGKCVNLTDPKSQYTNANLLDIPTSGTGENGFCTGFGPESDDPQINTALGCISITPVKFAEWLLPKILGITGGISFLLMVYGFILITFSQGDPKKIQGAKETITSAIIGLLVSVFAFTLLRLIVSDILKIPGF
jgi:hypothetical protein